MLCFFYLTEYKESSHNYSYICLKTKSIANLNTLSNLSWLPYPAYALQVCMYLMSALSVGLFEIDVLGERHIFRI